MEFYKFTTIAFKDPLFESCSCLALSRDTLLYPKVNQFAFGFTTSFVGLLVVVVMLIDCSILDFDLHSCHQSHPSFPHLVGLVVTNHFYIDLINFRIKVKVNLVKLGLS